MNAPYPGSPEFHAAERPSASAIIDGETTLSFAALDTLANALAASLSGLGVGAASRIGVRMGTRHEWFVVQAAASKLGAALVGINNRSTADEARYMLADSGASAFVTDDRTPDDVIAVARSIGVGAIVSFSPTRDAGALSYAQASEDPAPAKRIAAAPAAFILYTSGTTGKPKGVALSPALLASRPNVQAYREHVARVTPYSAASRFLLSLPMHHGAGPNSALFCLRAGGSVIVQQRYDAEQALGLIARYGVTNWTAVPTMINRIAALPDATNRRYDRSSLRAVGVGAAAVPVSLKRWAHDFFGSQCVIVEGYGMTETQMISYLLAEDWDIAPDSSGKPAKFVDVKICGPDGAPLAAGATGEICVKTPLMIDGYLNRPPLGPEDLTADGYFRTGDVGRLDAAGYLYVTDRIKDMIIIGGANVYPAEVEAVLAAHPAITEAAVIGVPDPDMGERVLAICEMKPGATADAEAIIAYCRASLAGYKVPKDVAFTADLPRTATGKVMKGVLRAPFWEGRERKV